MRQTCECGYSRRCASLPKVQDIPARNLLLSAAIVFAGCTPKKVLRLFSFMNVFCISMSTFFQHQRSFLWPAEEAVWLDHTSSALTQGRGQECHSSW
ncbi:hypothetical protein DPMN_031043 [Dreissena polymorpha]|uniref:Uncharacterized protein n=1 Tax=Dreissena polymorpha TaxID=45954 RepID=A0A9D4M1I7_DREPO|nr:hypothetical protein DPMN_031043 [Dreissena polymorpha]